MRRWRLTAPVPSSPRSLEVPDDFLPLLIRDETGLMKFLDIAVFHIALRSRRT
jgi:hypothetical protein